MLAGSTLAVEVAAADLFWVGNGIAYGGNGNWSSVANNWSTAASPGPVALTVWNETETAVFFGSAGTVNISDPNINAQSGLRFESDQFILSGGSLSLTGASSAANPIDVAAASTANINAVLAGSAGVTKTGPGTLVLNAANTYSGETVVEGGTLQLVGSINTSAHTYVGYQNSGVSLLINGVAGNADGNIGVAAAAASNNVTVSGAAAAWNNSGSVNVGYSGSTNSLALANSGVVTSANGNLGVEALSQNNFATVTGSGAAWTNSGDLTIGYAGGLNSLTVSAGGVVSTAKGVLGLQTTSTGNLVLITGANSLWGNTGQPLYIGYGGGTNTFRVESGAVANSSVDTVIGELVTSDGNALAVKDAGSKFQIPSPFTLIVGGFGANNTLDITNGAVVTDKNGRIGRQVGSDNNIVTVAGSGSAWNNSDEIRVGMSGIGNVLTVRDGASVTAVRVTIARNTGSGGTVNIGAGGAAGTLTGAVTFGDSNGHVGTGVLNFNHTDPAYTFANVIAGPGTVRFIGSGTTIVSGANTYSGGTSLMAGTLQLGAANALPSTGNFDFSGGVLAANDQTASIGPLSLAGNAALQLGTATARQDIVFASAAPYVSGTLNINGWDGAAGGVNYDRLIFTADPTASGILDHIQFNGYPVGALWLAASGEIVPVPASVTAPTAIPTLSPIGVAMLLLLLGGAAFFQTTRQRN